MPRLVLTPGKGGTVSVVDSGGTPFAPAVVAHAVKPRHRDRPLDATLELSSASGAPLGVATVAKFKITPRTKQLDVAVGDDVRFAVVDDRGEHLVITSDGRDVGRLDIATVKAGFLRKSRVYTLEFDDTLAEPTRSVVLGVAVGYEALLQEVLSASMRD